MHRRLKKLEGPKADIDPVLIVRNVVAPSWEGPQDLGISIIRIPGVPGLSRFDFPSDDAFRAAVDAACLGVTVKRFEWDGTQAFYSGPPSDNAEPRSATPQKQRNTK